MPSDADERRVLRTFIDRTRLEYVQCIFYRLTTSGAFVFSNSRPDKNILKNFDRTFRFSK